MGPLFRELCDSTVAGCAYGATTVLLSHPLDTIKTRQQTVYLRGPERHPRPSAAEARKGAGVGPLEALVLTWQRGGVVGLYAGLVPSAVGAMAFKSLPFIAYSFTSQQLEDHAPALVQQLPIACAFVAGASGGMLRSLVECPLEVIKVRKQAGIPVQYHPRCVYAGAALTIARNVSVIGLFWAFLQGSRDLRRDLFSESPALNSFLAGGGCSVLAWACIYPLDVVKSRAQARVAGGAPLAAAGVRAQGARTAKQGLPRQSAWAVAREVLRLRGPGGFYQGLSAGLARSLVANGCSMVIYDWVRAALRDMR